jgi:hypothetical protein
MMSSLTGNGSQIAIYQLYNTEKSLDEKKISIKEIDNIIKTSGKQKIKRKWTLIYDYFFLCIHI